MTNAELYERARRVIPTASQTYSKSAERFGRPLFFDHGAGPYVWDVEGNRYIDMVGALGPMILGYDAEIVEAVRNQLPKGASFSGPTEVEVELSELLCQVTGMDMCRFGKNGADATAAAARLARAYTGRWQILRCGYHGYQDWCIDSEDWQHSGVFRYLNPATGALIWPFRYGDLTWVREHFELAPRQENKPAAIITEPVHSQEVQWPEEGYLQGLRDICDAHGALLIFDEVFTFGRFPGLTAANHFGIKPDLICVSKALANGLPLSAVLGRREIMKQLDEGVFYSTTFGGEALSLAAGLTTVKKLLAEDVPAKLDEAGGRLRAGLTDLAARYRLPLSVTPYNAHHFVRWDDEAMGKRFQQAALDAGVLIAYPIYHNMNACHTAEIVAEILAAYEQAAAACTRG